METLSTQCSWPGEDALMLQYHDEEWGIPVHDDRKLFEFIVLDAFQAGLSWKTILHRRKGFAKALANFDYKKVAKYDEEKIAALMQDESIIRNRSKIKASIDNACRFLEVQKEFGTFDKYIWQFTDYKTIDNKRKSNTAIAVTSPESDAMSTDLKRRGFKFVGSTICYAFMQAAGMVNDHVITCSGHNVKFVS